MNFVLEIARWIGAGFMAAGVLGIVFHKRPVREPRALRQQTPQSRVRLQNSEQPPRAFHTAVLDFEPVNHEASK